MNDLQIFNNEEFGQIRTVEIDGEPWFVGKDIANALDYKNSTVALQDNVDAEDKGVTKVSTLGGMQEMTIINESGLYSMVFGSRLPNAKKFKHWVTSEVLPTIRKTGKYEVQQTPKTYLEALKALVASEEEKQRLAIENAEMKPKAEFADAIIASNTTILVGDFAKILKQNGIDTGQNRLFKWFVDNHYLFKRNGQYVPTQRAMELELFKIDSKPVRIGDETQIKHTVRVTPQGQKYFINKLLKERNIA